MRVCIQDVIKLNALVQRFERKSSSSATAFLFLYRSVLLAFCVCVAHVMVQEIEQVL